jgi:hypothetical protein
LTLFLVLRSLPFDTPASVSVGAGGTGLEDARGVGSCDVGDGVERNVRVEVTVVVVENPGMVTSESNVWRRSRSAIKGA